MSEQSAAPALPVWQTTTEIFDYCWRNRRIMARFAAIPLAIIMVLSFATQAVGVAQTELTWQALVAAIVQALAYLPVTVTWYRIVVFGEAETRSRPLFVLGRLEWRVLWAQILLILLTAVVSGIVSAVIIGAGLFVAGLVGLAPDAPATIAVGGILGAAALLFIFVAAVRVSMIIALAATDRPINLKTAWRMTAGLGWRMLGVTILITLAGVLLAALVRLAAFLVGAILAMASDLTLQGVVPYLALMGQDVAGLLIFLATATLFGFVDLRLMSERPDPVPVQL